MKTKKVFIVDDDKIFHFIIRKLLAKQNSNIELTFFDNGHDAIELLKNRAGTLDRYPDIILLDINMPVLDGWQFLDEFRAIKSNISPQPEIYLVSSSDNSADRERARSYHEEVIAYFLKPMGPGEIEKIFLN